MIQSCLQTGQYSPCCPLCRTEIERMSDLVKEKGLAETIYSLFPQEVMGKVTTTHTLEKQKTVASNIKALADYIYETAEAAARSTQVEQASLLEAASQDDMQGDDDFLLLTIELVCLVYAVFIFVFLLWLRLSQLLA
jgi:hypothetical protein